MTNWLYAQNNKTHGPLSSVELKQLAASGQLLPGDLVSKEGATKWVVASQVKGLFVAVPSESPSGFPPIQVDAYKSPAPKSRMGQNVLAWCIFLLPPLGLYLLWHDPVWRHRRAWWVCGSLWAMWICFCIASRASQPRVSTSNDRASTASTLKPSERSKETNAGRVRIVEAPIAVLQGKHKVGWFQFSPDGAVLLVSGQELWHLASRGRLPYKQERPNYSPMTAKLSPNGKMLASLDLEFGPDDRESPSGIRLWGIESDGLSLSKKIKIKTKLKYPSAHWHTIDWSPRENYVTARSKEALIVVSDPLGDPREKMIVHPSLLRGDENRLGRLMGSGEAHGVVGAAFSPNEKFLAVAFRNLGVRVFNLPDYQCQTVLPFDEPIDKWKWNPVSPGQTEAVAFSDDGTVLATYQTRVGKPGDVDWPASTDSVKFWDTSSWQELGTIPPKGAGGRNGALTAVGFLSGRSVYATSAVDNSLLITLWNARGIEALGSIRPFLLPSMGAEISMSKNGNAVLFDQGDGGLQVWDTGSGRPVARIDDEKSSVPHVAAISPDARLVATGYPNGQVALWDISTSGREITPEELLVESNGATKEHKQQSAYLTQKAPAVTKGLFDQIVLGMSPVQVSKLLNGQPTKLETEVDRIDDRRGGKMRGIDLITRYTEHYRGHGRPDAKVVLIFVGQGSGPPLVKKYQQGLE
jgi:WD40 repeat protein